jgi:hypothetical protein
MNYSQIHSRLFIGPPAKSEYTMGASRINPAALKLTLLSVGVWLLIATTSFAFHYPLQSEEVREAYSRGQTRDHEELANFFKKYIHHLPYPAEKPTAYVESVEFRTPYEQIVLRSLQAARYTPFQAEEDYRANPNLVLVRFAISYKINYVGPLPSLDSFEFLVLQSSAIEPRKQTNAIICNPYIDGSHCVNYIREALLWFDAEQFAPGSATIRIKTPEGSTVQTKFDLDQLK